MPLSEEELRLLEQMERALVAEDPKLASTLRGTRMRANARRRAVVAGVVFVVGVAVLMTGAVLKQPVVGIVGFVVMLTAAYVGLSSWRGQNQAATEAPSAAPAAQPSLSLIEGGRSRKRSSRNRPQSSSSMMERFEERWRRRRDRNGY